jgi:glycosyltransferase involved in cell wall biosynthesis
MKLQILGTRGIPAEHGGFETFAEHFAVYLQQKGWQVTVYCQEVGADEIYEDDWRGIHLVHIPVTQSGAKGTIAFDWKSTLHAAKRKIPVLTLGYNTAVFCLLYRLNGIKNVVNMDGVEWRRGKWSPLERAWLYVNEKLGAWLANHLVADHPEIKNHLSRFVSSSKITVIPYSADILETADQSLISPFDLEKNKYAVLIARSEKENSILEIVSAYSKIKRGMPLVILGNYTPETNSYHKLVVDAAGDEVKFVGAIYDKDVVQALRFFARFYVHGHTVGGTNPSLVEALGAGSPVLAHNNLFNRWVAGEGARYFFTEGECSEQVDILLQDDGLIASMRQHSFLQMQNNFTWDKVHQAYEQLLIEKCGCVATSLD